MSTALRNVVYAVAILVLAILARAPLARAGWLGGDLAHLAAVRHVPADGVARSEALGWLEGGAVRPVAGAILALHERACRQSSAWSLEHALALRAIAFGLVLAAAVAAGLAQRRALLPWVGAETARAAGWALALFVAVHPLGVAATARPEALGDIAALVFSGAAAALFLLGRQERRKRAIFVAGLLAIAAGFSSPIAALLPFVLAGLELGSGRRGRPMAECARTAATTFVVFAGCVLLESVFAVVLRCPARVGFAGTLPELPAPAEFGLALELCVEKLGVLFFPVPGRGADDLSLVPAYIGCGALLLLALTPVLRSARAAPRLWGWLALAWLVALALALAPHAAVRVQPADFSRAEILFPAALFLCGGLAVAATALSGTRRMWIPLGIALGFAWIGNTASRAYARAGHEVAILHADLKTLSEASDKPAHVLVVDPATRAAGLDLGLESLGLLVDPVLEAAPENVRTANTACIPLTLERGALAMLARQPEFDAWRREGVAILAAPGVLRAPIPGTADAHSPSTAPPKDASTPKNAGTANAAPPGGNTASPSTSTPPRAPSNASRLVTRIPMSSGSAPPIAWRGKGLSDLFDVDPSSAHFARVTALPDAPTAEAPRLGWRTSDAGADNASLTGTWLVGSAGPVAVFDLSRTHEWWAAKTVRRVWTEDPLVFVATAELVGEIPLSLSESAPSVVGDDWRFQLAADALPRLVRGEVQFVLSVLDLDTLAYRELRVERGADAAHLVARGAERFVGQRPSAPGRHAWSLEARVGDAAIARASGRR